MIKDVRKLDVEFAYDDNVRDGFKRLKKDIEIMKYRIAELEMEVLKNAKGRK